MDGLRLGGIVPSGNSTVERELSFWLPVGASLHVGRVKLLADTLEELQAMADDLEVQVERVADARVRAIGFFCTAGSFLEGPGYDLEIEARMRRVSGVPCATAATAMREALGELGVRKVCLFTPYPRWLTERQEEFLRAAGFEIVASRSLGLEDGMDLISPGEIYTLARELWDPLADGMFISCTDFPSAQAVSWLEREFGKPVVTSNLALLWLLLRRAGYVGSELFRR